MSLLTVPKDIVFYITSVLSDRSTLVFHLVNKQIYSLLDSAFWNDRLRRRIELPTVPNPRRLLVMHLNSGIPKLVKRKSGRELELLPELVCRKDVVKMDAVKNGDRYDVVAVTALGQCWLYTDRVVQLASSGATDCAIYYDNELFVAMIEGGVVVYACFDTDRMKYRMSTSFEADQLLHLYKLTHYIVLFTRRGIAHKLEMSVYGYRHFAPARHSSPVVGFYAYYDSFYWVTNDGSIYLNKQYLVKDLSVKKRVELCNVVLNRVGSVKDICTKGRWTVSLHHDGRLTRGPFIIDTDVISMVANKEDSLLSYIKEL
jgi:hypothetical protein